MHRKDGMETKKKILSVCVKLFLEYGYKQTSVNMIIEQAGVARGSYQNLFHTKDCILEELVETMFDGQFAAARKMTADKLPPLYIYAVETAVQLTLTELNENLREIYLESYTLPNTSECIHLHTAAEIKNIFADRLPNYTDTDFYEFEIGSAGLMRGYMAKKCDVRFPLKRKITCFLTAALRMYNVPKKEIDEVTKYVNSLDLVKISSEVIEKLFLMLEVKYDFKLHRNEHCEDALPVGTDTTAEG